MRRRNSQEQLVEAVQPERGRFELKVRWKGRSKVEAPGRSDAEHARTTSSECWVWVTDRVQRPSSQYLLSLGGTAGEGKGTAWGGEVQSTCAHQSSVLAMPRIPRPSMKASIFGERAAGGVKGAGEIIVVREEEFYTAAGC